MVEWVSSVGLGSVQVIYGIQLNYNGSGDILKD